VASDEEDTREEIDEESGLNSTYTSFTNRTRTERWGIEETRRFYRVLRECGTDFTLMLAQFPGRTQKQLKAKFKKESSLHPDLIDLALNPARAMPISVQPYTSTYGQETIPTTSDAVPHSGGSPLPDSNLATGPDPELQNSSRQQSTAGTGPDTPLPNPSQPSRGGSGGDSPPPHPLDAVAFMSSFNTSQDREEELVEV